MTQNIERNMNSGESKSMRKILFLDIDGVVNSHDWWDRRPKLNAQNSREEFVKNQFDPIAVDRVRRIIKETKCEVVLSSVWRLHKDSRDEVKRYCCEFNDYTGECDCRIRGAEIYVWIRENVPRYYEDGVLRFAILDDDSDMLMWQKDQFFRTDTENGLTDEIADAVIQYLNYGKTSVDL